MKNLKIFLILAKQSLKTTFQGRVGVILFMLGKIVRVAFIFVFLALVFSKTKLIKGYTLDQILIFYLTFNIIDTAGQILFREVYRFRPLVVSGQLDLILLKPYHPFIRILVGGIDCLDAFLIFPYIIGVIYIYMMAPYHDLFHVMGYLLLLCNSMILVTAFHIIVLALGILTTDVDHTIMIYRDFTTLGRFPMDIYKEPIKSVFTFVIPVGIMMSVPAQSLIGVLSWNTLTFSFLISLTLLYVSLGLWKFALKKYQSWGG